MASPWAARSKPARCEPLLQNERPVPSTGRFRLSKKLKSVAVGGHAPTTATPLGKFCGKLCARSIATSARFAVKFCRRAAEPSAACGGCSEAEQGQRSQNASAVQGAPHDAGTATRTYTRGNSRVRQLPCAAVSPCAACRRSLSCSAPFCFAERPTATHKGGGAPSCYLIIIDIDGAGLQS